MSRSSEHGINSELAYSERQLVYPLHMQYHMGSCRFTSLKRADLCAFDMLNCASNKVDLMAHCKMDKLEHYSLRYAGY